MQIRMDNKRIIALLAILGLAAALAGCGGGGGGGGGGGTPVTVTGTVLRAETNSPTDTPATVTFVGGPTITANADGTFTVSNVSSNITSATISATGELNRTITIKLQPNVTNNLGNIYIVDSTSAYTAKVTGRVVTTVNNQPKPVGGATVTIANVTTTTATDGTFELDNLPVGLGSATGTYGQVVATGFVNKPITDANLGFALVAGANPIGDLLITQPSGSIPPPPYTITGIVKVSGVVQPSTAVTLSQNGNTLGSTTTDANGAYFFWVVPGTYTITASHASVANQQENVTLSSLSTHITAPTMNLQ